MIQNINLAHLKYFYDSVLLKSASAAARVNFVSQSAISQGILKLEQALQVKLTTHERQGFKLTQEGEVVFREAKTIFADFEHLKNALSSLKSEISGDVHFVTTNAIAQFFLAVKYLKIRRDYPLVKLSFDRESLPAIHESLKNGKAAFALAVDSPNFNRYEKKVLSNGHFHLYKAKGTAENHGIFVDHPDSYEVTVLRKKYFETHQKELILEEALSGWGMVATFVLNGCGIGFLPEFIFAGNDHVEKVEFDLPPIAYSLCAFTIKGATLSLAAEAVLKLLEETYVSSGGLPK